MYVDPNRNTEAGNLKWILPYCKPDLPRVAGAIVLFCVNNTMALIIPLLSGLIVDRVIVQGQVDELTRLCIMMLSLIQSDAADDLLCVDLGGRRIIKKKKKKTKKTKKKKKKQRTT